jgi:hypothetical protein
VADVLSALQRDQATLSNVSCHVIAERSGHAVAFSQPEIVVEAIRATVEATRHAVPVLDCDSIESNTGPTKIIGG